MGVAREGGDGGVQGGEALLVLVGVGEGVGGFLGVFLVRGVGPGLFAAGVERVFERGHGVVWFPEGGAAPECFGLRGHGAGVVVDRGGGVVAVAAGPEARGHGVRLALEGHGGLVPVAEAAVAPGFKVGARAPVLALAVADKGDGGDDDEDGERAADDAGDGAAGETGFFRVFDQGERVDDLDGRRGEDGVVEAEDAADGGLLQAAGLEGDDSWS